MKLFLVRHTSVLLDGTQTCYGASDIDVRPTFVEEARQTKARLDGLTFDGVFSSPLQRAYKLASFCGYADAQLDDRLRETNFGAWEGRPWVEIMQGAGIDDFFARYLDEPFPEGESLQMQCERVREFLLEQQQAGYERLLIFCHGGIINCVRSLVGHLALMDTFATIPPFGSVTELDFEIA